MTVTSKQIMTTSASDHNIDYETVDDNLAVLVVGWSMLLCLKLLVMTTRVRVSMRMMLILLWGQRQRLHNYWYECYQSCVEDDDHDCYCDADTATMMTNVTMTTTIMI